MKCCKEKKEKVLWLIDFIIEKILVVGLRFWFTQKLNHESDVCIYLMSLFKRVEGISSIN